MLIEHVEIRNLRSQQRLNLPLEPMMALVGPNGVGKTTVLEALSLLCSLKSFRPGPLSSLIRKGQQEARVSAIASHDQRHRRLELTLTPSGRSLRIDNKAPTQLSEYFSSLKCVSFAPEDVSIVRGEPAKRRAFLDRMAFTLDPLHLERVRAFQRQLRHRNASLKSHSDDLDVWTLSYIEAAKAVTKGRRRALETVLPEAKRIHHSLTDGRDGVLSLSFSYSTDLNQELARSREKEVLFGTTLVGPHRDRIQIRIGEMDLRQQGSQGQVRSALLALKLALATAVQEHCGVGPIFLLDDVGGELDDARMESLLLRLSHLQCQVLLSAPEPRSLAELGVSVFPLKER